MNELLCHLIGDYILQSEWMANNKTNKSFACACHVLTYGIPFFLLGASWSALFVIVSTHFLIDRFRLAKYVVYAKNFIAPAKETLWGEVDWLDANYYGKENHEVGVLPKYRWGNCQATGYPSETPPFLAVWLLIIADNTLHLLINHLALKYL